MAITYSSNAAQGAAANPTSGSFIVGSPSVVDDCAVVWWYSRDSTKTFTENADTTPLYDTAIAGSGRLFLGYHRLVAQDLVDNIFGEWTSSSVTNASTCWGYSLFRGVVLTGNPFEADSGTPAAFTNAINPDPPAVNVATVGAVVFTVFGKNDDYTSITVPTNYAPAGAISTTSGTDASAGTAYRAMAGTGSEDPGAWTLGGGASTNDGIVWTGSILPAGAAAAEDPMPYVGGGYYFAALRRLWQGWTRRPSGLWMPPGLASLKEAA